MVEIGLVFRDLTKLPNTPNDLRQFIIQSIVPAVMDKLDQAQGVPRVADPVLDQRAVEISVGIRF